MLAINQKLILQGVGWDFYERMLEEYKDSNALHFAFDDGFLEVEVPLLKHEIPIRLLADLVTTICIEQDFDVQNVGSTTIRKPNKAKGCEPDTAFYIQNVRRIKGLSSIDLSKDPPPDLVIEVDITSPSLNKLPIYAALGVPEIWLYRGEKVEFYKLYGDVYQAIENSLVFPILTSEIASDFLKSGTEEKYSNWIKRIRNWINRNE